MTTDDRLLSGATSESPNKSSGDIGERLRYLSSPAAEQLSDFQRINAFVQIGHESAAEIERLRREVEDSHARIKRLSDALLTVRPLGGSELFIRWGDKFHADPDYCKEQIERLRTSYHDAMKTMVHERKRADTAESAVAAADSAFDHLQMHSFEAHHNVIVPKIEWDAASAIRAAVSKKTAESGHSPSAMERD